jgi:hypothetical protein
MTTCAWWRWKQQSTKSRKVVSQDLARDAADASAIGKLVVSVAGEAYDPEPEVQIGNSGRQRHRPR